MNVLPGQPDHNIDLESNVAYTITLSGDHNIKPGDQVRFVPKELGGCDTVASFDSTLYGGALDASKSITIELPRLATSQASAVVSELEKFEASKTDHIFGTTARCCFRGGATIDFSFAVCVRWRRRAGLFGSNQAAPAACTLSM